jgi:hypothetical protein
MAGVWVGITVVLMLACVALYGVRRLDDPPTIAVVCAALGSAGAVGLTALPIAAAGGVDTPGVVGARQYVGTKQGAKIAAGKIAEAAGFGWAPVVRWQDSQGGWLRLVPCGGRKA